jgi:hypothetical protein
VIEKLLENWLDNATERSYQQVFVQMLSAQGYTVLHSTRHCLLEFGKDILAIAPDGVGCAFQLKGDPRGQMTIGAFRSGIQQQLVQLLAQSPSYPGFPTGVHRSFLVSNGSFSEEVQVAVSQMNSAPYPSTLELWSRGTLLDMALKTSESLWPSEIRDTRRLLDIYMADPRDQLPLSLLAEMLTSILHLGDGDDVLKDSEFKRATSSAIWATGIALSTFARAENHQANAYGWTLCRCMLQCAALKFGHAELRGLEQSYRIAENASLDALAALWDEVRNAEHLVLPPALEDSEVYGWRMATLHGLLAALYLANTAENCLQPCSSAALREWICNGPRPMLWGEAAVGQIFSMALALGRMGQVDAMGQAISQVAAVISATIQLDSICAYPSPYYSGEEALKIQLTLQEETADAETFAGGSYMARPLLLCLATLDMKAECQALWPDFSRLTHRSFEFSCSEDYLTPRALTGREVSKIYSETYEWAQLKVDATPKTLQIEPLWLQSLWWQVAPHRADAASMTAALKLIICDHEMSSDG